MSELPIKWMWRENISTGLALAEKDVWSRASRRASRLGQEHTSKIETEDEEAEPALGVKVRVESSSAEDPDLKVTIRWLKGHDTVLFESLCGMIKRKLDTKVNS